MIIRFTAKEKDEINRIINPLEQDLHDLLEQLLNLPEEHFTITDGFAKPRSKEAIELSKKEAECKQKLIEASTALYNQFEDRRFKKIESKPDEIMRNAIAQTDAIIANIVTALHINDTNLKPEELVLYHKNVESLRRVWTAELYKCIVRAKGNIEQLDAQIVIAFIKKELHRHYEKLDASNADKLTQYIEQTVTKAIPQPRELPSGYFKAFYDKKINAMTLLNSRYLNQKKEGQITIHSMSVGGYTFYVHSISEGLIKLGVETHKIILYAISIFTQSKPNDNIVYFSLDKYIADTSKQSTYSASTKRQIRKRKKEYIDILPAISFSYSYEKQYSKRRTKRKGRFTLFQKVEYPEDLNSDIVGIEFSNQLSTDLKRSSIAQYPHKILRIPANDPNTYRIALALSERYSNYKNVIEGTENVIGLNTLWSRTDLASFEDTDSHYKRDIIESIEGSLNKLMDKKEYKILKSWFYIKPKKGAQTPQERRMTKREVEELRNDLLEWKNGYIAYEMEETIPDLTDKAKEYQKKQDNKLLEKREKEAIKAAKALEKIEGKSVGKN